MKKNSIFRSTIIVSVLVVIFKIIAFVKQAVVAYFFGASLEMDIYNIAHGFIIGIAAVAITSLTMILIPICNKLFAEDDNVKINN